MALKIIYQYIYSSLNKDLNFNPYNNYNTFENKLTGAITKHTTMEKKIKLNKSKHKKNPWITEGLIKSIKFRDMLHMTSKTANLTLVEYQAIKIKH